MSPQVFSPKNSQYLYDKSQKYISHGQILVQSRSNGLRPAVFPYLPEYAGDDARPTSAPALTLPR